MFSIVSFLISVYNDKILKTMAGSSIPSSPEDQRSPTSHQSNDLELYTHSDVLFTTVLLTHSMIASGSGNFF